MKLQTHRWQRKRAGILLLTGLLLAGCGKPADEERGAEPAAESLAAGDTQAGLEKSVQCVACHGARGMSDNDAWPDLAGQSAVYIAKQLRDFRDGRRQDPWMTQMALPLTDADIRDLAAYFASLAGLAGSADSPPPPAASCGACHSSRAINANPLWPALAGQNEWYLAKQLQDFRDGRRADPVMAPLAQALSAEEVAVLAAYFAGR